MIFDPNPWLLPAPAPEAYNYAPLVLLSVLLVCGTFILIAWMRR